MSSPSSSLRPPPRYDTVRHSQLARKGPNHNAMKGGMRGLPFRSLRFAPPMQPPPPSRISVCSDVPSIRSRDFRDFVPKSSAAPANLSSSTLYTDTLAKISELAEITRASIPMAPLEDDADSPAPVPDTDESRGDISRPVHLEDPVSHREPMPPPPPPGVSRIRTSSPASRRNDRNSPLDCISKEGANLSSSSSRLMSHFGIQVDIVHRLNPAPVPTMTSGIRSPGTREPNLGFPDFSRAVAFLSTSDPPLNPLEIESSKDVLISLFAPKMTLYRCGGCDSAFIFRSVFSDHFYRVMFSYRLRCAHCKELLSFPNICQVKDHVKSHGFKIDSCKGFALMIEESKDELQVPRVTIRPVQAGNSVKFHEQNRDFYDSAASSFSSADGRPAAASKSSIEFRIPSVTTRSPAESPTSLVITGSSPNSATGSVGHQISKILDSMKDVPGDVRQGTVTMDYTLEQTGQNSSLICTATERKIMQSQALPPSPFLIPRPVVSDVRDNALSDFQARPQGGFSRTNLSPVLDDQPRSQQIRVPHPNVDTPPSRHGPTISVGKVLENEFHRSSGSGSDAVRQATGISCPFCSARFENQGGMTHHYQRCKDVTRAGVDFRCPECKVVCCNACSFEAHKLLHRVKRNAESMTNACCPECGRRLNNVAEIGSHVERRCVHRCRVLCCSYSCCIINCRYHSSNEDDFLSHIAEEHGGQGNGRNVCPVCKVQVGGNPLDLLRHFRLPSSLCRQRLVQQKTHFFAYRCNLCGENEVVVYETKAEMREHMLGNHADNLVKAGTSGLMNLLTETTSEPKGMPSTSRLVTEYNLKPVVKRIRIAGEEEEVVSYQTPVVVPREPAHGARCVFCAEKGIHVPYLRDVEDLEAHLYSMHITRMYPTGCFHCGKNVNSSQDLLGHLLQQVLRLPVTKCDQCDFITLSSNGIVQHKTAFHQQRHAFPYICGICRKMGFDGAEKLQDHLRRMHVAEPGIHRTDSQNRASRPVGLENPNPTPTVIQRLLPAKRSAEEDPSSARKLPQRQAASFLACRLCDFETESHAAFADHIQIQHPVEMNEASETRLVRPRCGTRYTCKVCESQQVPFICDDQIAFHEHVRNVHPAKETSFQCSECALQLLSLSVLQMHLRHVHDIPEPAAFLVKSPFYSGSKMIRSGVSGSAPNNLGVHATHFVGNSMAGGSMTFARPSESSHRVERR